MADSKITALTSISTSTDPANDPLVIVDVSDTSMAATGTTKKVTLNQLLGASGTATLASATITGDLTVDTNTLKVDSVNNRVIVGHTSGSSAFQVSNAGGAGFEVQPTGVNSAPALLSYNRSGAAWTQMSYLALNHVWQNSGSEVMRIDSSGRLLVGTTDAGSNSGIGLKAAYSATAPYFATVGSSNASNTYSYLLYSTTDAAFKFYVSYSGQISATSGTISAISDARLKENVQDIDVGLGAILALKPRKFDWKAGKGKDIKGDRGFIAQEFEQVFPNLIDEWKDPAPEGEAPYKSVRQDLIPVLVKAIQELAARVQTLETR